jgi:hypothetical protein
MVVLGVGYAIVGLFNNLTDVGIGVSVAALGVIGAEYMEWRE